MTPAKLRELADREDAAALRALDQGDTEGARDYRVLATLHREVAAAMERQGTDRLAPGPKTAHDGTTMDVAAEDSRGLKIAKTKTAGRKRHKVVQALYDAGLTPATAAALCGTTRDVLKQAWGRGEQFREIRPEWEKRLAEAGVSRTVWPRKG